MIDSEPNSVVGWTRAAHEAWIFYEKTTAHLDNGAPVEKAPTLTQFFTKCTVLYSKSMHNTQNQPSQQAMYTLFNCLRPLIAKSADIDPSL